MYMHVYSTTDLVRLADGALEGVLQAQHWDGPGRVSDTVSSDRWLPRQRQLASMIRVHK